MNGTSDRGERIGLVGCVKTKADAPCPARDLYLSPLFEGRRHYVERSCDRWFVLSAEHGLVDPEQVIGPYDVSLLHASTGERRQFASRVLDQIDRAFSSVSGLTFEVHAGASYRDFGLVDGLLGRGAHVEVPAHGLTRGEQLRFYKLAEEPDLPRGAADGATRGPMAPRRRGSPTTGRYAPLAEWLRDQDAPAVRLSFAEIEHILGKPLPASSRRHQAWWANTRTHSHAFAWLDQGWQTSQLDLNTGQVTFHRTRSAADG